MGALRKLDDDRLTIAEFLVWDSGDRTVRAWQLIDGVPQAMAPATRTHGAILAELARLIGNHLVAVGSSFQAILEPGVVPRVNAAGNVRIPDLAVVCSPPSREPLIDDPVLIVEILSPSNASETYANIWAYTTIPSLREILVISSTSATIEILRRLPDGNWPQAPERLAPDAAVTLASIGMNLAASAIYAGAGFTR